MSWVKGRAVGVFRLAKALPALILSLGLIVTFLAGSYQQGISRYALDLEFSGRSHEMFDRIQKRLHDYERVLRGGGGVFASVAVVGRNEWRTYVNSLNIDQDIPGVQGLGFCQIIKSEDKPAHIERIRREGFSDYAIHPEGDRELYTPTIYLEPFSGANFRAFGYDLYSNSIARTAMSVAGDEGRITLSGKIKPAEEADSDNQAGFQMYLPVYTGGALPGSVVERRSHLYGWVFATFKASEFMKSLVGDGLTLAETPLDILIFDGDVQTFSKNDLLYHFDNDIDPVIEDGLTPMLMFRKSLTFGGHEWTIIVHSPYQFDNTYTDKKALFIELSGTVSSFLLAIICWLLMAGGADVNAQLRSASDFVTFRNLSIQVRWQTWVTPYALAGALSVVAGLILAKADAVEEVARHRVERSEVESQLNAIRLRLERALTVPMNRTRGMAAQIIAHGDVSLQEFNKIAEVLLRGYPAIRNIGVSRGTKLEMLYPLAGNERALGTDYRSVPWQWPMVKRAIETRVPVIQGPIALIQGGSGLILRDPVFLADGTDGGEHFFGLVSLVLNMPDIYAEAGLIREDLPVTIAIRGVDGQGELGKMIYGENATFLQQPVELDVNFPYGKWRLAAVPKGGWIGYGRYFPLSRLLGGAFFLFLVIISFGVARHINERQHLLNRIASSGEQFRNLLRIASDGIHILDEDGNLVMCSDSFLHMLGYSEAEAHGLNIKQWDVVFSPKELREKIRDLIPSSAVFETKHRRRDNTEIDVEINACAIDLAGKPYLYASARDVSERKVYENQLRIARHAAESAAAAKANFLAIMSHEVRTPVTSVMAVADLLQKTILTEEQAGYIKILKSSTVTLLTVLNDILDISKIESGKIKIESAEFSLHETVREIIAIGQTTASTKGLRISLDIFDSVPDLVIGDTTRVRQVLFNLVSNAIKFTEAGSISVRMKISNAQGTDTGVLFEVEDTGIGISCEQIEQLFAVFSQADATTTRRFGGTGLGLAISKKLVDLMGGQIGVKSEPGVGSMFWFLLPFKIAPILPALSANLLVLEKNEEAAQPLKILLAEDNRINQLLIRSMLMKMGHTVEVAENGRVAVDAVTMRDFDVVLMDMQMPEMDGEEATKRIRAMSPPKGTTPILALTADAMVEHRNRYLMVGVDELVPKPIDWQVLSEALARHAAEGRPKGSDSKG